MPNIDTNCRRATYAWTDYDLGVRMSEVIGVDPGNTLDFRMEKENLTYKNVGHCFAADRLGTALLTRPVGPNGTRMLECSVVVVHTAAGGRSWSNIPRMRQRNTVYVDTCQGSK